MYHFLRMMYHSITAMVMPYCLSKWMFPWLDRIYPEGENLENLRDRSCQLTKSSTHNFSYFHTETNE